MILRIKWGRIRDSAAKDGDARRSSIKLNYTVLGVSSMCSPETVGLSNNQFIECY